MEHTVTQVEGISAEALTKTILEGVESKLNLLEKKLSSPKEPEYLTRKEAAKLLGVSLVTINDWSKKGILKPRKIGSRVRFKKSEIYYLLEKSIA